MAKPPTAKILPLHPRKSEPNPELVERFAALSREATKPGAATVERYQRLGEIPFLANPEEIAGLSREEARGLLSMATIIRGQLDTLVAVLTARLAEPEAKEPDDELLTVEQVAALLKRKPSYVAELIRRGRIPVVDMPSPKDGKNGKYYGLFRSSVLAWAKANETGVEK